MHKTVNVQRRNDDHVHIVPQVIIKMIIVLVRGHQLENAGHNFGGLPFPCMNSTVSECGRFRQAINRFKVSIPQAIGPDGPTLVRGADFNTMHPRCCGCQILVAHMDTGVGPETVKWQWRTYRNWCWISQRYLCRVVAGVVFNPFV